MIINSKHTPQNCQIINVEKKLFGKEVITQAQMLDGIMMHCETMRKKDNNGFSKKRRMRLVAEIPELTFIAHRDDWLRDPELQKRWLRSEEGQPFLLVKKDSI